ncbi:F0F1 ATP synthase subunit gamma [Pleurocapsa sp. PCC 7319]|uniref:F0F1 ATP synthase subunit gamma n=1 Tax=Pleurocapsa sp. PCC 7319 TaxID=118161 RepID=UPI0003490EB6|nr:F0F1 ATP synthase subunit gamma [Pleurocapsa sp. PCC 7319]
MATIEELKHKIATAKDLNSVVKTMKAVAAVSIRQYEKAVESLTEYDRTLEIGLQILLRNQPEILLKQSSTVDGRIGIIVFGSDWGMCGQFNERVVEYIQENQENWSINADDCFILALGSRVCDRLEATGHKCEACFTLPSSIGKITSTIQEMVLILETWRQQNQVNRIIVIYNRILNGATYNSTGLQIFPLNFQWLKKLHQQQWRSNSLPTFTMNKDKLAAALFRQYFFVSLYRACAESLKSEHSSRLAAMQMAEKNIAERLTKLNMEFNHQRQTIITEELFDIVSGFEALTD